MIIGYNGKKPVIGNGVFIAPTAVIVGDVTLMDGSSVWFNAVVRGDLAPVTIGRNTNIQDNCTVHTDKGMPAVIGDHVTVGHNCVIHGCTIERNCLIGMNAVVLNGAHIHEGSLVAAGSVVKMGERVGPFHLVAGIPAVVKKRLADNAHETFNRPVENYLALSRKYRLDSKP